MKTLWLLFFSGRDRGSSSGTFLAALRVSPVAADATRRHLVRQRLPQHPAAADPVHLPLRAAADLGFTYDVSDYFNFFFVCATIGLGLYTAAFVCEAMRSGINSIPLGQAEAARAIGMTFAQSMTSIILPQAFRAVIPPLTSTYIALAKNTSVALAIGVTEATFVMKKLNDNVASERWPIFFGFAFGYVLIVAGHRRPSRLSLERSVRVAMSTVLFDATRAESATPAPASTPSSHPRPARACAVCRYRRSSTTKASSPPRSSTRCFAEPERDVPRARASSER